MRNLHFKREVRIFREPLYGHLVRAYTIDHRGNIITPPNYIAHIPRGGDWCVWYWDGQWTGMATVPADLVTVEEAMGGLLKLLSFTHKVVRAALFRPDDIDEYCNGYTYFIRIDGKQMHLFRCSHKDIKGNTQEHLVLHERLEFLPRCSEVGVVIPLPVKKYYFERFPQEVDDIENNNLWDE